MADKSFEGNQKLKTDKFQFVGMVEDVYVPYSKKRINNLSATPKKVALFLDYFIIIEYILLVGVVTSK